MKDIAKRMMNVIDSRIQLALRSYNPPIWCIGKVESGGVDSVSLFINNSSTSVLVRNPHALNLVAGDLVFVWLPNGKLDNMAFVDHKL